MGGTGDNGAAVVKVVGIGGAGGNIVSYMLSKGIAGVEFVVMNMDKTAIQYSPCSNKVHLKLDGRGEGQPWLGQLAAIENRDKIEAALRGAHMVILTAGMGGSCGTGAIPVVAQIAKEMGALVVCVVTTPFHFEGQKRMEKARGGIDHLLHAADSLLVLPNEMLVNTFGKTLSLQSCFDKSNDALLCGIRCLSGLISEDSVIGIDFWDVKQILEGAGLVHFASIHYREGGNTRKAVEKVMENPLLSADFFAAKRVILSFDVSSDSDIGLADINDAFVFIQRAAPPDALILLRVYPDARLDDIRITVLATGFEAGSDREPVFQILALDGL